MIAAVLMLLSPAPVDAALKTPADKFVRTANYYLKAGTDIRPEHYDQLAEYDLLVLPAEAGPEPKETRQPPRRATSVATANTARIASRPEPAPAPPDPAPQPPAAGSAQGEAANAEKAVIAFAVTPWGEVFVNGAKLGVSPPVNVVEVNAGKAEIEIRYPGFPSYTETVELAPGQRIRVKHKF